MNRTTATTMMDRGLSDYELEILREVPTSGNSDTKAYVVWQGWEGIEMGPVRWASDWQSGRRYSVSPFPGAWTYIDEADIIRVRHIDAMSIRRADAMV